jgi:hypothetical protein
MVKELAGALKRPTQVSQFPVLTQEMTAEVMARTEKVAGSRAAFPSLPSSARMLKAVRSRLLEMRCNEMDIVTKRRGRGLARQMPLLPEER